MVANARSDKALQYQALFLQINNQIKSLDLIGLDTTVFKNRVEIVNNQLNRDLKVQECNFNSTSSIFLDEIYINAISNLEKISNELEENREEYYIISVKTALIKSNLKNMSGLDISVISKEAAGLLDKIENSSTVDYSIEKNLIEDAYKVIYQVMKLEALYSNKDFSSLFSKVNNSNIHSSFISNLVRKEIASTGNQKLLNKQYSLESKGREYNVLINSNLFRSIALVNNKQFVNGINDILTKLIHEYRLNINVMKNSINLIRSYNNSYENIVQEKKRKKHTIAKRISLVTGTVVTSAFLMFGAFKLGRKLDRVYPVTSTVYDLQSGEVTIDNEPKYEEKLDTTVLVLETEPWVKRGVISPYYERITHGYYLFFNPNISDFTEYVEIAKDSRPYKYHTETLEYEPADFDNQDLLYSVVFNEYGDEYKERVGAGTVAIPLFTASFIVCLSFFLFSSDATRILRKGEYLDTSIVEDYKELSYKLNSKRDEIKEELKDLRTNIEKNKELYEEIVNNPLYKLYSLNIEQYEPYIEQALNIINNNPSLARSLKQSNDYDSFKI